MTLRLRVSPVNVIEPDEVPKGEFDRVLILEYSLIIIIHLSARTHPDFLS